MNPYSELEQLWIGGIYFEEKALKWFKWENAREAFQSLNKFKTMLIEKYDTPKA